MLPMDTQKDFVAKRIAAHKAAVQNLDQCPLVRHTLDAAKPLAPLHPAVRAMLWGIGGMARRQAE